MRRDIIIYPDSHLVRHAAPVVAFNEHLTQLVVDMHQAMFEAKGLGLAAPQVGINKQVIVYNIDGVEGHMMNPEIVWTSNNKTLTKEGCLSFPGVYVQVERPDKIIVRYQDTDGKHYVNDFEQFLAVCIQHEIDHLTGVTLVNSLSGIKRGIVKSKMTKLKRQISRAKKVRR